MDNENKSVLTDSSLSNQNSTKPNQNVQKNTNNEGLNTKPDLDNKKAGKKEKSLRTTLKSDSIDLVELEQLNEQNLRNFRARSKRNRAIIIVLTVLLVAVIVTIGILLGIARVTNNCFLYINGDGTAVHVVDGNELSRFRTPGEITGNRLLEIDLDLKIESSGSYNVRFTIQVFQDDQELENTIIYEPNRTLFSAGNDGYYYSKSPISGEQTINLCQGVLIDYHYENTLNINNFRMEVHTYLESA